MAECPDPSGFETLAKRMNTQMRHGGLFGTSRLQVAICCALCSDLTRERGY